MARPKKNTTEQIKENNKQTETPTVVQTISPTTIPLKFKTLYDDVQTPVYATDGSNGLDLFCYATYYDYEHQLLICNTGIAVEIPKGYVGLLFPRSSVSKKALTLANCVGVIDSDYRGEIIAKFRISTENLEVKKYLTFKDVMHTIKEPLELANTIPHDDEQYYYAGEKCVQLILVKAPTINLIEVDELSTTERGNKGFGEAN